MTRENKEVHPRHNIRCVSAETRTLYLYRDGQIRSRVEGPDPDAVAITAIIATFANLPKRGRVLEPVARVRAAVTLISSIFSVRTAPWIGEVVAWADLVPGGPRRELLLAYKDREGDIFVVEDRRESAQDDSALRSHQVATSDSLTGGTAVLSSECCFLLETHFVIDVARFEAEIVWQKRRQDRVCD